MRSHSITSFSSNHISKQLPILSESFSEEQKMRRVAGVVVAVAAGALTLFVAGIFPALIVTAGGVALAIAISKLKMSMQNIQKWADHAHHHWQRLPASRYFSEPDTKKPGSRRKDPTSDSSSRQSENFVKKPGSRGSSSHDSSSPGVKKPGARGSSDQDGSRNQRAYKKPGSRTN